VAKLIQGFYLAIVFTANHNHLEIDMKHLDHLEDEGSKTSNEGILNASSVKSSHQLSEGTTAGETNWVEMQCHGTVNYSADWATCIMTGFLNFQIEHHLCPTMPECNYRLIAKDVRDMCETFNLPYRCDPFHVAMMDNHMALHKVAKKARADHWGW